MWHASVSAYDGRGARAVAALPAWLVEELEVKAWALAGTVGDPQRGRWDISEAGHVLHLRHALTEVELVALSALHPDFLACPAVHTAGPARPYRPRTGLR